MAINASATIIGNLTRDPTLKYTPGGMPICEFGVAWNNRRKGPNGDMIDETSFFDVVAKFKLAENIAETLQKGDRVIISGHFEQRSWTTQEGEKRYKVELVVENAGPDLSWAIATITKNERDDQPEQRQPPQRQTRQAETPVPNVGADFDWSSFEGDFR